MPRFLNDQGRTVTAQAGSFLERRLLRDGWKVISEGAPVKPSAQTPEETNTDGEKPSLAGKTRAELNEIASGLGIESPESLPNIAAVKAAIEEA